MSFEDTIKGLSKSFVIILVEREYNKKLQRILITHFISTHGFKKLAHNFHIPSSLFFLNKCWPAFYSALKGKHRSYLNSFVTSVTIRVKSFNTASSITAYIVMLRTLLC